MPDETRHAAEAATVDAAGAEAAEGHPVHAPALLVSGFVVRKANLVAALRLYVPQLADIEPLDGDRFFLSTEGPSADGLPPALPGENGVR